MVTRIHKMSDNIVGIMNSLRFNDRLVNLSIIDKDSSRFDIEDRPDGFDSSNQGENKNIQFIKQNSKFCRLSPTPFNPNAEEYNKTMIRVYYNQGDFDSEIITESMLFVDIIVAKELWLCYDEKEKRQVIRPYEIMDCIIDTVGRKSINPLYSVNFTGYQHLAVNSKFDAIRLYSESFKVDK